MGSNDISKSSESQASKPVFSETEKEKARLWFQKGQSLAAQRNYDYAIATYLSGLEIWPDAVEEGHKPCRAAALFRGPKKISLTDTFTLKTIGKDPKKAMLTAERLLAKDPANLAYMETILRNAAKAGYDQTILWIGDIIYEVASAESKPNPARFALLGSIYEEMGDRCEKTDRSLAITAYERGVKAVERLRALKPQDMDISKDLNRISSKLTLFRGSYDTAETFTDSVRDSKKQAETRDIDRDVQSKERLDELIASSKEKYNRQPEDRTILRELVKLLCSREEEDHENEAISILGKAYQTLNEYTFKQQADDIRMKQLRRKARLAAAKGDKEAAKEALKQSLKFDLAVFKERCKQYPTDLRLKYEYGHRLFQIRHYDDAIPLLQEARSDPKSRDRCNLLIGRCFFEKGYHSAAIDTFQEAIRLHENPSDETGKDLNFRLGQAFEAVGRRDDALKIYSQVIQSDFNYRQGEVRKRIDDLRKREPDSNGPKE